jgi:hypothetical protein
VVGGLRGASGQYDSKHQGEPAEPIHGT